MKTEEWNKIVNDYGVLWHNDKTEESRNVDSILLDVLLSLDAEYINMKKITEGELKSFWEISFNKDEKSLWSNLFGHTPGYRMEDYAMMYIPDLARISKKTFYEKLLNHMRPKEFTKKEIIKKYLSCILDFKTDFYVSSTFYKLGRRPNGLEKINHPDYSLDKHNPLKSIHQSNKIYILTKGLPEYPMLNSEYRKAVSRLTFLEKRVEKVINDNTPLTISHLVINGFELKRDFMWHFTNKDEMTYNISREDNKFWLIIKDTDEPNTEETEYLLETLTDLRMLIKNDCVPFEDGWLLIDHYDYNKD